MSRKRIWKEEIISYARKDITIKGCVCRRVGMFDPSLFNSE